MIRLAYQSFGSPEGMEGYRTALTSLFDQSVGAEVDLEIRGLESVVLAGKGYASAQALDVPDLLRSVARAVQDGAEAVAIGNGFDPGVWEARELFDVPILGWFESISLYALRVGWKVGVICSGTSGPARIEDLIRRYGIGGRVVAPVAVGVMVPEIMVAFDDQRELDKILARVQTAGRTAAAQGADVLMVASGALDVLLEHHHVAVVERVPVLPGVRILVAELETAARLARSGVPFVSRYARFKQPPEEVRQQLYGVS